LIVVFMFVLFCLVALASATYLRIVVRRSPDNITI
jgi:hypothetical protein